MLVVQPNLSENQRPSEFLEKNIVPITHAARPYHAFPGSRYALPSDDVERQRLLLQHKALREIFGDKLLFAPISLGRDDKVLDVGTGSGVWLLDLATSVDSSVSMVGVDIESRLFPTSPPENLEFGIESVTRLPADWSNTFSLVHQRLLILALQVHEWPGAIQEIYRVLRPGGWIQIDETRPWYEAKYPGKPCMEKLTALFNCVARARNLYINCTDDMSKMLTQAGFVDIRTESRFEEMGKWAGEVGVANRMVQVEMFRGLKTPVLQAGGFGYVSSEAEYEALLQGLQKEWDEIPGSKKEVIIFWARKPAA
ncbi:S-adenosyl-L-methionine-dependent methyltransferase [Mycena alexandri]|uniref:S-adenosyl-L-methionine-dependent methyltransferase n=1 Tax=Mycena alexandri TaxID=1745969 RepID=A0AAD6XJ75_9AGAR|nr:S-adenosyl-L-methionine-dependent methyltransferase [Mycena alexandri]